MTHRFRFSVPVIPAVVLVLATYPLIAADTPAGLTAEQDHALMMKRLGIESVRRGADADPASAHAANYDESRAGRHMDSLPALLELENGDRVETKQQWWQQRRPELIELFNREVYGMVPEPVPAVEWTVDATDKDRSGNIDTIRKSLTGGVDNGDYPAIEVNLRARLTVPADATGSVPVALALTVGDDFWTMLRERFGEERVKRIEYEAQQSRRLILEHGWGYAELVATSVQADNGAGLTRGIVGLTNKGRPRDPDDWGTLRAWAWGASRLVDYLETDEHADADRVAIHGHSRYGKVAMAYDRRFAAAYISSSGEGGAKLWRRHYGEQIGNIAGSGEYHWMAGNFLKYAGPLTVDDLPVDAHQLIALCAPRPVFIGAGDKGDEWVDPKGMFLAAHYASPAYRLLGGRGLEQDRLPDINTALIGGDLAFSQHDGGHTPAPNWEPFLTFAERYF